MHGWNKHRGEDRVRILFQVLAALSPMGTAELGPVKTWRAPRCSLFRVRPGALLGREDMQDPRSIMLRSDNYIVRLVGGRTDGKSIFLNAIPGHWVDKKTGGEGRGIDGNALEAKGWWLM